jgi:hypothetical protein
MGKGKRRREARAGTAEMRAEWRRQADEYAEYLRSSGVPDVFVADDERTGGFRVFADRKVYGTVSRDGAVLPKLRYPYGQEPPPMPLDEVLRRMCGPH